jgi:hypothetical protein
MPQKSSGRKVKSHQQMIMALELRASGASYFQIAKALSVSKPRAFRIVRKALDELVEHCTETVERVRQLELHRLDRYRLALDSRKSDPRTVDTLIRISERVAKLHGLDAPQRIEASGPDGGPIQTQEQELDLSKLTFEEKVQLRDLLKKTGGPLPVPDYNNLTLDKLLQFEELYRKVHGLPTVDEECHVINNGPYSRKWYAAQRAAEAQPALTAGS